MRRKNFVDLPRSERNKNSGIAKNLWIGNDRTRHSRHVTKFFTAGKEIGIVTSGTFSPTLNKAIGLAFIDINSARRILK